MLFINLVIFSSDEKKGSLGISQVNIVKVSAITAGVAQRYFFCIKEFAGNI